MNIQSKQGMWNYTPRHYAPLGKKEDAVLFDEGQEKHKLIYSILLKIKCVLLPGEKQHDKWVRTTSRQRKGKNYTHGALHMRRSQELIHNAFNERRKMNACFSGQKGHEHLGEAIGIEGKKKEAWFCVIEKEQKKECKAK